MATDSQLIVESLERAGETIDDISPLVYERFFRAHPEAVPMFGSDPGNMIKGHMFNGILYAVLDQAEGIHNPKHAFYWAMDHVSYEATLPMFSAMFAAIAETLGECLGDAWTTAAAAAWQRQFDVMMVSISAAFASAQASGARA